MTIIPIFDLFKNITNPTWPSDNHGDAIFRFKQRIEVHWALVKHRRKDAMSQQDMTKMFLEAIQASCTMYHGHAMTLRKLLDGTNDKVSTNGNGETVLRLPKEWTLGYLALDLHSKSSSVTDGMNLKRDGGRISRFSQQDGNLIHQCEFDNGSHDDEQVNAQLRQLGMTGDSSSSSTHRTVCHIMQGCSDAMVNRVEKPSLQPWTSQ